MQGRHLPTVSLRIIAGGAAARLHDFRLRMPMLKQVYLRTLSFVRPLKHNPSPAPVALRKHIRTYAAIALLLISFNIFVTDDTPESPQFNLESLTNDARQMFI